MNFFCCLVGIVLRASSLHPSLLPWLNFTPNLSSSSIPSAQGDWEWVLWSVHHTLSLPLLYPQRENFSHSSSAPAWSPSCRRQFSTNCSNRSPSYRYSSSRTAPVYISFHSVQSFRKRLLQHESPTGSQFLPANLVQHQLLLPQGDRSYQEAALAWRSHRVTAFFEQPPTLARGPPRSAGGYLVLCEHPWAAGDNLPLQDL